MKKGQKLCARTALPVIVAPMFLVSGVELVVAACREGVIGTFPALNGRSSQDFEGMLKMITERLAAYQEEHPAARVAPFGVNLIVHRSNPRVQADLELCGLYKAPLIITSLGKPDWIVQAVHSYGGLVFADVATIEHAQKAAAGGVDGLILVCAGAGGHAGTLNPFAFVPAVRAFFDGIIAVAGCLSDGRAVRACEALGADFAYMGTRFIPTFESQAQAEYKAMVVSSEAADIVYTPIVSGVPASFLRASLERSGYDLSSPENVARPLDMNGEAKVWRDTWSAGQGVQSIHAVESVQEVVARLKSEYNGVAYT